MSDEQWRYLIRKLIRHSTLSVFLVTTLGIGAQRLHTFCSCSERRGSGLAIALAPTNASMARWALIISSNLYEIGDRKQLGGVIGDFADMDILEISQLEIGKWITADRLTGRAVNITNAAALNNPAFNYMQGSSDIWDELTVPISYGPHWERAEPTIIDAVSNHTRDTAGPAQLAMQQLPRVSFVGIPDTGTHVYISLTEHWVACTLRYVVQARARHQLQILVLKALTQNGIEIASPALTMVKYPAERNWKDPQ